MADRRREHHRRPPDRRQLAGTTGLDIAIWRPEGSRWVRPDTAGTPLANTATVRVSERSAVPTASGMIIAGSVLDLGGWACDQVQPETWLLAALGDRIYLAT